MKAPDGERVPGDHLYQEVARSIVGAIEGGALHAGQKVPSVRHLSAQRGVSISTVLQAYRVLESGGWIEARPQSGYFVRSQALPPEPEAPSYAAPEGYDPADIHICYLAEQVARATGAELSRLSVAVPGSDLLPTRAIDRAMSAALRANPGLSARYDVAPGCEPLRLEIARRQVESGCTLSPDDIFITTGATDALNLALRAVTRPGDTVALESPTYFGALQILESLGLRALELPTHPREGVSLAALEHALDHQQIKACLLMPCVSNPLGSSMADESKRDLVALLAARGVPLIEDDVYGDLSFGPARHRPAKAFDTEGNVLLCSSFSKTLGPGLRVGWIAPGRFRRELLRLKVTTAIASASLPPLAVAEVLRSGGYDHYLRRARKTYSEQMATMTEAIARAFPPGTCVTRPSGGFLLWVEMPQGVDALKLFAQALGQGVGMTPGHLFSARHKYLNCLRLNAGLSWSPQVESAIYTLGKLAAAQLA